MSVGQGSYFRGWSALQTNQSRRGSSSTDRTILLGQVLSIDYNGNDAGVIRVRLLGLSSELKDDDVRIDAYPANINNVKYPLPGEIVLVVKSIRNEFANNKVITVYYYMSVVNTRGSVTYNSDPYIGNSVPVNESEYLLTPEYEHRFENKIKNLDSFIKKTATGYVVKDRPALRPNEGDFIIQNRFGSSVRLGSTGLNNETEWSDKGGIAGDPIIVLSNDRTVQEELLLEQVDKNDSAFYICSTQTVPVDMATSSLTSHLYTQKL